MRSVEMRVLFRTATDHLELVMAVVVEARPDIRDGGRLLQSRNKLVFHVMGNLPEPECSHRFR